MLDIYHMLDRIAATGSNGEGLQEILKRYDIDITSAEFRDQFSEVIRFHMEEPHTELVLGGLAIGMFVAGLEYAAVYNDEKGLNLDEHPST